MVDAVNLPLLQDGADFTVEGFGRFEVAAEGFFDDDPAPEAGAFLRQTLAAQLLHDEREELRQSRKVVEDVAAGMVPFFQFLNAGFEARVVFDIGKITLHVIGVVGDGTAQGAIGRDAGVGVNIVVNQLAVIVFGDFIFGETEDGEFARQQVVASQVVERGDELARGEIAGGSKDHHDAAIGGAGVLRGSFVDGERAGGDHRLLYLHMTAELLAHRGEYFFSKSVVLAGSETNVERGGENLRGDGFFDGGVDGPAAFARILH